MSRYFENVDTVSTKLIMATVAVIIIAAFAIPTIVSFAHGPGTHPGDTWDYTQTANIEGAQFTFDGTAMQYQTVTDNHIYIVWGDKGHYELVVTATTHMPEQTATKTFSFDVKDDWEYTALLLVIPTLMIISIIIYLVRPIREGLRGSGGGRGGGDDYQGDISSKLE